MTYSTDDRIGLIIRSANSSAKCITIIRHYNPISIAEIRHAIDTGRFVLDCSYTSDTGIRKIIQCYDELTNAGAVVEIYEDGDLTTREFLSNLMNTYQEIADETDLIIDEEAGNN